MVEIQPTLGNWQFPAWDPVQCLWIGAVVRKKAANLQGHVLVNGSEYNDRPCDLPYLRKIHHAVPADAAYYGWLCGDRAGVSVSKAIPTGLEGKPFGRIDPSGVASLLSNISKTRQNCMNNTGHIDFPQGIAVSFPFAASIELLRQVFSCFQAVLSQ